MLPKHFVLVFLAVGMLISVGSYFLYFQKQTPAAFDEFSDTMVLAVDLRSARKAASTARLGFETYLLSLPGKDAELLRNAGQFMTTAMTLARDRKAEDASLVSRVAPLIEENQSIVSAAGLAPTSLQLQTLEKNNAKIVQTITGVEGQIWDRLQTDFVNFAASERAVHTQYQLMLAAAVVGSLILFVVFMRQHQLNRELRKTEKGLRESERLLREAQALASLGNWSVDLKNGIAQWSDEQFRLLGYQPGSVHPSTETFINAVHPDDRQAVQDAKLRAIAPEERSPYHIVHRVRNPGGIRYLEQQGQVEFSEDNEPLRLYGTTTDITDVRNSQAELVRYRDQLQELVEERTQDLEKEIAERKQIQDELRKSETRLRQILDSSSAGISILRVNPIQRVYANQRFLDMFHANSMEQLDDYGFKNTFVSDENYNEATACVSRGEGFSRFLMERRRVDNSTWWGILDAIPIEFEDAPATIVWHYDITDQKLAERELVEAEKLASLGGLVAGIAHEVNTPIGVGLTAASFLEEKATEISELTNEGALTKENLEAFLTASQQSASMIVSNLHRASDLVRSFKQVAVDQSSDELRTFKLLDYVEEILRSLLPQTKKTPHKITVTGDEDIMLSSYPGALSQIITNLVMNSLAHAFEDGTTGEIGIVVRRTGSGAQVDYRDNGRGVTPEVLGRIFDPFFTTKRGSGGSGLGMHIVYNLATRKLGGTVACESEPGQGICVRLTIPLNQDNGQEKQ